MPFQLSRGQMKLLTAVTLAAFVVGLACVAVTWVTHDWRWGVTSTAALILGLALNQRRLAGQIQRRTNQVIEFYGGGGPDPLSAVIPAPRSEAEVEAEIEAAEDEAEAAEGRDTP